MNQAEQQKRATKAIQAAGGWVRYDFMLKPRDIFTEPELPGPDWLVKFVGVDYFSDAVWVDLSHADDSPISENLLQQLSMLPGLHTFSIGVTQGSGFQISDNGMKRITSLKHLEHLDLSGAHMSKSSLKGIEGLTNLRTLNLRNSPLDDSQMLRLRCLARLTELRVSYWVSDKAIAELKTSLPGCNVGH